MESPMRAEGLPPTMTLLDPFTIESGGPTHIHMSPTQAAGIPPINTVSAPGPKIGPPTWGIGGTLGVTMGQVCISPNLAAGGIFIPFPNLKKFYMFGYNKSAHV